MNKGIREIYEGMRVKTCKNFFWNEWIMTFVKTNLKMRTIENPSSDITSGEGFDILIIPIKDRGLESEHRTEIPGCSINILILTKQFKFIRSKV